ncbi:MAG: hypothetical protein GF411_14500 [Candidatus Lokiarchaeota archaeon]|nr:hypothetical protein [Candidatus Lokiarchaeota archaeon]
MNTQYYMTIERNGKYGQWEPCKATTPTNAKREATKRYKGRNPNSRMVLAKPRYDIDIPWWIISSKINKSDGRWVDNTTLVE